MKNLVSFFLLFCFLFNTTLFTTTTFAVVNDEEDTWEYEFGEFDDDYLVLTPERQKTYIDNTLNAIYTPGIDNYENYMEIYYDNLTNNLGKNYKGSCGYIAIGMLLSYYDAFLNDDIIPEQYDVNGEGIGTNLINWQDSPGIFKDEIDGGENLSSIDYYDVIKEQSEYSLHAKLIKIGHMLGYYNYLSASPVATTFGMLLATTNSYLKVFKGYTCDQYDINYEYAIVPEEDNAVKNFVINNIQNNKPVLLAIQSINAENQKEGHVVIAYDYDEITDKIFCHFGWGADKTHVTPESEGFTLYKAAFTVDFNLSFSHAYNYTENKGQSNEKTYCSCYFSCHPEHEHSYISVNSDYHTYSCNCVTQDRPMIEHFLYLSETNENGHKYKCTECNYESELIEHNMRFYLYATPTQHGQRCVDCKYIDEDTLETHSYDYWVCESDTTHRSECTCGSRGQETAPHAFVPQGFPNVGKLVCVGCGYVKILGTDTGNVILSTNKVSQNGSYILPDGTIMLVEEDIEAYLNGTLVFYDRDNLPQTQ